MSYRYLVPVVLVSVALAGCIGGLDPSGGELPDETVPDDGLPTKAVIHGANGTLADVELPGGAVPVGVSQLTGFPAFEPTIGVQSDGTLFMSNWGGEIGTGWTSVVRSTDQGATWEDVTPSIGPVSSPPQSNDPYVYVDEATDRVYNLDMQGLECNWIQWSDDGGQSWTQNPIGCGATPLLDHPTIFAGPPTQLETQGYENVVYLCVNRVADSACSVSLDGGMTWSPFTTVFPGQDPEHTEVEPTDPIGTALSGFCGGLHAHGVTDSEGRAFLPKGHCGVPTVAVSTDNGLTWERHAISTEVGVKGHEVALAVDAADNVYATWIAPDRKPYLSVSTDHGKSWSEPVRVSPDSVGTADFPTIAAGAEGRIAVGYVGTEADVPYHAMGHDDTWNAYLTTSVDALAKDPTFATAPVNDPSDPIARNECGNSRCYAPEGGALGDFIDVVIDEDGRPWGAFVDACTGACANETGHSRDEGIGLVGTFAQGPSLTGNGTLPALPWADV